MSNLVHGLLNIKKSMDSVTVKFILLYLWSPRFLDFPPPLQPTFFSRLNTWGREGLVPPSFARYRTKKEFELKEQRRKRLLALMLALSDKRMILVVSGSTNIKRQKFAVHCEKIKDDPCCSW